MRVTGHEDILEFIGPGKEKIEQLRHLLQGALQPRPGEELDVQGHLVVAGAACVNFLSQGAQAGFHLGVHILASNHELAFQRLLVEGFQGGAEQREVIGRKKAHLL